MVNCCAEVSFLNVGIGYSRIINVCKIEVKVGVGRIIYFFIIVVVRVNISFLF
jgi:hypothetical protein